MEAEEYNYDQNHIVNIETIKSIFTISFVYIEICFHVLGLFFLENY